MPRTRLRKCDIGLYRSESDRSTRECDYKYARGRADVSTPRGREHRYNRVAILIDFALERTRRKKSKVSDSPSDALRGEFGALVDRWRKETRFSSSSEEKILHEAYQSIIALGKPAVPLVLQELEARRGHWSWALRFMTGSDPVPEGANIEAARAAWLEWGRKEGLLK